MPEVITNNLDLWSSALLTKSTAGRGSNGKLEAYGIKKLRELILELAVRGKLAPQDANDEPASELLKHIQVEKTKLIVEGKIKKDNSLLPITEDEKPFELPRGWEWVRLGTVVDVLDGLRKPVTKQDRNPGPYPYYGASGVVDYVSNFIFDEPLVLVGEDGAKWGRGENTAFLIAGKTWVNNHAHVIRPYRAVVIDDFVARSLNAMDLSEFITGMTVPKLNQARLVSIVLPLPPITEQRRIVAKVEELMALCDQLEQQQTHSIEAHQTLVEILLGTLTRVESQQEFSEAWVRIASHFDTLFTTEASIDQLKQTILQLAVMGKLVPQDPSDEPAETLLARVNAAKVQLITERKIRQSEDAELSEPELFDVPVGWLWVHVKDVAIIQGGKRLPNGAALLETPTPHIYIRVTDMKNGTVLETGLMYMSPEVQRQISRYTINKEDLYITIAGTIGDVGVIPDTLDGQNLTENAAKIVFRILDKRFLQLALSSEFVQEQFLEKTKQLAQPKLALKRIAGAKFCLPPLNEQHRIVSKVDELMTLCDSLNVLLADAQAIQLHLADAIVEQALI